MIPETERKLELEPYVDGSYHSLIAGFDKAHILIVLDARGIKSDEIEWIFAEASLRFKKLKDFRAKDGDPFFWCGAALIGTGFIALHFLGSNMPQYRVGQMITAILAGIVCIGYGIYCKFKPLG